MSRTHETRDIKWHETCKYRLDASVFNNKQRWNKDKYRCECKELIEKGICDNGFIWNPSYCECECNKPRDIGQYLDYKSRNDKLVEECSEIIDGNKMSYIGTLNDYGKVCNSCNIYIVLFFIAFLIIIGISSAYFYFRWYLKKYTETTIY